jgi:hypothetical protein
VLSVSLFSSGGYIASGSFGGEILIREAEIVEVEVGPIEMKQDKVFSLASFHLWVTKLHQAGKTPFLSGTGTLRSFLSA